jgi:hypothetical protein
VAAAMVERVDAQGQVRYVGTTVEARREMLKVARLLPPDVVAEIYEDPRYPGRTYLELYLAPAPPEVGSAFRLIRPDRAAG